MDMTKISKKLDYLLNHIKEQAPPEEEIAPEEAPEETVPEEVPPPTGGDPAGAPDSMGADPMAMGGNMAGGMGGMMGMPGEEPQAATTPHQIGRVYEMKKIFARLTSLESHLSTSSDIEIIKLRQYVSQAIDLFKVMISNLKMFMDKIDDIIITYYKFLDIVYSILNKYYSKKGDNQIKNRTGGSTATP